MRILLLAKKPPYPPKDGEAIAVLQMAKGLHAAGADLTVLYMNTKKHHYAAENIPAELTGNIRFISVIVQANITLFGALRNVFNNQPYHVERFQSDVYAARLKQLLDSENFDMVQAEGLYLVQYFELVKRSSKAKCIYRSHNIEADIWGHLADHAESFLKRMYLRLQAKKLHAYEFKMIHYADRVVPISISDAKEYEAAVGRNKIKYIPAGIDMQTAPPMDTVTQDIYFIGGLDWMPNLEGLQWFLQNIFPEVKEEFPGLTFHIAGRNAPPHFKKMLPAGVHFYGEVEDAAAFAADKMVLVVPLLSGGGMKVKIAEAMCAGKYVITTDVGAGGMPPGMEDFFTIAHDENDFIFKLTFLLKHDKATRENALHGQEYVCRHLNNNSLCRDLFQYYQSL